VDTLDQLDEIGIAHVGTYRSPEEKKAPFIVDIEGIRVAFLSYTADVNGREPREEGVNHVVNLLDVDAVAKEAMTARIWGADVVIAVLHFGEEYTREPSKGQTVISEGSSEVEGLLSRGVDVILGAHSHMVQPIVKVLHYSAWRAQDTYVAYSLGNFLTGQRWRYSDSGIIAYVHIKKDGLRTRVTGISYLPVYIQLEVDDEAASYRILPVFPGLVPQTDTSIEEPDEERMDEVWEETSALLYRPDEGIVPLIPFEIYGER
jgi:poly-gamma-glutamate capsule biosynthesis protein CapA/YwtB (metallophosphatase superfamily)